MLRLARDAWLMVIRVRKATNEYDPLNPPSCEDDNTQFSHVTHSIEERDGKVGAGNLVFGCLGKMWPGLVLIGDLQVDAS